VSFKVRSAAVNGDSLTLVLVDAGGQDVALVVEGTVSTTWNYSERGYSHVTFAVSPQKTEAPTKHLNEPPVNF